MEEEEEGEKGCGRVSERKGGREGGQRNKEWKEEMVRVWRRF